MMKSIYLLFFLFGGLITSAQQDAWVYLNAKPNSQSFLDNPLSMLSQRALDRRTTQNIALDFQDVPVFQSYIDQIDAAAGISVLAKSKWLNAIHVRGSQSQINALQTFVFVDHLDFANKNLNIPGRTASAKRQKPVNKTFETDVLFNYGDSGNQIEMLNGHLLHQQNFTGSGKIIAIMDGGFPGVNTAQPFARLRDNNQILGGYDFVNRNDQFYNGISHGTLVLSTMAGFTDNELVGTAPDASYYLFITEDADNEGPLEESLWVEAAERADSLGVDIINTSLGYSIFDNEDYNHTYADMDGVTTFISRGANVAFSRGMICVVSAGNEGNNDWFYITTPADATTALTVGAVNSQGNYASFSSQGPSSDGRIKPDVAAQGLNAVLAVPSGNITTASGTSFSGPIIAGMVASFWQALPDKTNAEIIQLIKESASIYNNPDTEIGYGIPDFSEALISTLGLSKNLSAKFSVYPNPITNNLSVSFPDNFENATIAIYSSLGQKVLEQKMVSKAKFDVADFASGMYLYQIKSGSFIQNGKFIKQ